MELRGTDAGKWKMICALPALWTGILYDQSNLDELWDKTKDWNEVDILSLYQDVCYNGLQSNFINKPVYEHGKEIISLAISGLQRRGYLNSEGKDESIHLEELKKIVESQKNPADLLIDEYNINKDISAILNQKYY